MANLILRADDMAGLPTLGDPERDRIEVVKSKAPPRHPDWLETYVVWCHRHSTIILGHVGRRPRGPHRSLLYVWQWECVANGRSGEASTGAEAVARLLLSHGA